MKFYLTREIQLFYPNKKLKCKVFQLLYPNILFKKWREFNCKNFKYNAFQFLRIVEMHHPNTKLECVWMKQLKRVIHLFEEFEFLLNKMTCFDEEIKRKLKLKNFKKVFQITKIIEFKIHSERKKLKFDNLWNSTLFNIRGVNFS